MCPQYIEKGKIMKKEWKDSQELQIDPLLDPPPVLTQSYPNHRSQCTPQQPADTLEEPMVPETVYLLPSLSCPGLLPFSEAPGMPELQGVTKAHAGAALPPTETLSTPYT